MAELIPGAAVTLPATIASFIFGSESVAPERQTVSVRLRDGQTVETNLGNLESVEPAQTAAPELASEPPAAPPAAPPTS